MADDVPDQHETADGADGPDVPGTPAVTPAATTPAGADVPLRPAGHGSEWSFEWQGLVSVLAIVVLAVVGWRVVGGDGSDDAGPEEASRAPAVTTTTDVVAATTTVVRSSTVPTTVARSTTTTTPEPTVDITGEMKPCRFGDNCLVASFTIVGFDDPPESFTCIYPNSRRDFTFRDGGKDEACITADQGDTITIEVGGVSSKTISEANLDGE